jgi:hypothetical protein
MVLELRDVRKIGILLAVVDLGFVTRNLRGGSLGSRSRASVCPGVLVDRAVIEKKKSEGRRRGAVLVSWSASRRGVWGPFIGTSQEGIRQLGLRGPRRRPLAISRPTYEPEACRPSFQTACHSVVLCPSSSQSNFPSFHRIVQMVEATREQQRRIAYMLMVDDIDSAQLIGNSIARRSSKLDVLVAGAPDVGFEF